MTHKAECKWGTKGALPNSKIKLFLILTIYFTSILKIFYKLATPVNLFLVRVEYYDTYELHCLEVRGLRISFIIISVMLKMCFYLI